MIPVQRPSLNVQEWLDWRREALEAIDRMADGYNKGDGIKIRQELYRKAMPFLLKVTHNKCAYCETVITSNQPGDVEHYRPKGRIRNLDGTIVHVTLDGKDVEHPGYWWLCYEWENLLPSCADCNRRRKHGDDESDTGKGEIDGGKGELFPILGPRAARREDSLSDEEALLLDPSATGFDPHEHFEFSRDGMMAPRTQQASATCTVLALNKRETLVRQRREAYSAATSAVLQLLNYWNAAVLGMQPNEEQRDLRRRINDMWEGRAQYSIFAKLALEEAADALAKQQAPITFPVPMV